MLCKLASWSSSVACSSKGLIRVSCMVQRGHLERTGDDFSR